MHPSLMRDFNDDFFSGPMGSMRRMESMIDNMMQPFGGMFGSMGLPQQMDNRHRMGGGHTSLMPFGFGQSLFPHMGDMFTQMGPNPHCHSFSSSSVMSYTTDESGQPHVYKSTSSSRTAPGGVKETRSSVQDSRSGLQQMSIGHHLNERAHVIEKKKYRYTGEEEENHEFVNLEDDEADNFDHEWKQKAQAFPASQPIHNAIGYGCARQRSPEPEMLAITDSSREQPRRAERESVGAKKKSGLKRKAKHGASHSKSHGRPPAHYE